MIVLSEDRYVPVSPGFITLQDEDGVYYYIHKTFYEQAVVIEDRYSQNVEALKTLVGGNQEFDCIRKFVQYVPRPMSIMGYFLGMLKEDVSDFRDIVGAMDVIASALNLRRLIQQPESIRQSVVFSLSVTEEYQDRWDLFFQECYPYEQLKTGRAYTAVASATASTSTATSEESYDEYLNEDGSLNQDTYNAYMMERLAAIEAESASEEPEPEPEPVPVQKPSREEGGDGLAAIATAKRRRTL